MRLRLTMIRVLTLLIGAGSALATLQAQVLTPRRVAARAVESYFQPGYRRLLSEARQLEQSVRPLCATPDDQRLGATRDRFGRLVEAWSRIELVRFGPALKDNRIERILFWPDRRGIGLRQTQAILAAKDDSATDPVSLRAKSVAAQGLIALEYALFGSDSDELKKSANAFRCRYAMAIAGNIASIAEDLNAAWTASGGIATQLTHPSPGNPTYRTDQEALSRIVGVLAHGLEAIRDTRIKPMLGTGPGAPKPKAALYWRSGLTVASLRANFAGLRALFEQSRIADALPAADAPTANSIRFEFRNVERALSGVTLPVAQALDDPRQHADLAYLVILSRSLQKLIGQNLSIALGLSVGFSSADGD